MIGDSRNRNIYNDSLEIEWGITVAIEADKAWLVGARSEDRIQFGGEGVIDLVVGLEWSKAGRGVAIDQKRRHLVLLEEGGSILRILQWLSDEFKLKTMHLIKIQNGIAKKLVKLTENQVNVQVGPSNAILTFDINSGVLVKPEEIPLRFLEISLASPSQICISTPHILIDETLLEKYMKAPIDPKLLKNNLLPELPQLALMFKRHNVDETQYISESLNAFSDDKPSTCLLPVFKSLYPLLLYRKLRVSFAESLIEVRKLEAHKWRSEGIGLSPLGRRIEPFCSECGSGEIPRKGFKEILLGEQFSSARTLWVVDQASHSNSGYLWHKKCFDKKKSSFPKF